MGELMSRLICLFCCLPDSIALDSVSGNISCENAMNLLDHNKIQGLGETNNNKNNKNSERKLHFFLILEGFCFVFY